MRLGPTFLVLLPILVAACLDKDSSPSSPDGSTSPLNEEQGGRPLTIGWNGSGRAETYYLEVAFEAPTNCTLDFSLAGFADDSAIYWIMGIRWPASFGLEQDWGWGYGGSANRVELLGQGTSSTIPGLLWTTVGSQEFGLKAGDNVAVTISQFTPDAATPDWVQFNCDGPAEATLLYGSEPLLLSPASAEQGAATQVAETFTTTYSKELQTALPLLFFGCYCPSQDPLGFHDLVLDLPSNSSTFHFEGDGQESVLIFADGGNVGISLTSASIRGRLLLGAVAYEVIQLPQN